MIEFPLPGVVAGCTVVSGVVVGCTVVSGVVDG